MLIFKHAIDHKNFFAAVMPVWVEISLRGPPDQSRSTALLHERHNVQTRHHALIPRRCCRVQHFSLHLIRTQVAQLHKKNAAGLASHKCTTRNARRMAQGLELLNCKHWSAVPF